MMSSEYFDPAPADQFVDRLASAPRRMRRSLLTDFLREQLAYAIGVEKADIAADDRLMDLGVDSLRAVEVKLYLEEQLGVTLSSSLLFDYPTLDALAPFLLDAVGLGETTRSEPPPARTAPDAILADDLPADRIAELLASELAEFERLQREG
jgi:acyl carrier protein